MSRPPPFRDSDERDEALGTLRGVGRVEQYLAIVRDEAGPTYQLTTAGSGVPLMPTQAELDQARDVLDRVGRCLMHDYAQRRRPDDPLTLHAAGRSRSLDDEEPF